MISIRGAITVDENTKEAIYKETTVLLEAILNANFLEIEDIVNITFSCTKDLTAAYPAVAARDLGIVDCSLMCVQEMYVENSMPMCLRMMILANEPSSESEKKQLYCQKDVQHVYLKAAKILRPDLAK